MFLRIMIGGYKATFNKKDKFRISESTLINDNDSSFHIFRSN